MVTTWHRKLVAADVPFAVKDYERVISSAGDVLYLDPPYRTDFVYYGRIDFGDLSAWLRRQRGGYLLSLNGHVGGEDRTVALPGDLYDEHIQIEAGDIPFHRLSGRENKRVTDSLYIRRRECWKPTSGLGHSGDISDPADARRHAASQSGGRSELIHSPRDQPISMQPKNKSDAIRSLLDADPEPTAPAVRDKLAADGIEVSLDLVRVVRMNRRKDIERRKSWRVPVVEQPASPAPSHGPVTNPNHVVVKVDELAAEELRDAFGMCSEYVTSQGGGRLQRSTARFVDVRKYMPTQDEAEQIVHTCLRELADHVFNAILHLATARVDAAEGLDAGTTAQRLHAYSLSTGTVKDA